MCEGTLGRSRRGCAAELATGRPDPRLSGTPASRAGRWGPARVCPADPPQLPSSGPRASPDWPHVCLDEGGELTQKFPPKELSSKAQMEKSASVEHFGMGNDFFLEICGVRGETKDSPRCSLRQRPGPPRANSPLSSGPSPPHLPPCPPLLAAVTLGATGRRVPAQALGGLAAPQTSRAAGTGGHHAHAVPHGCLCRRQSHPRCVLLGAAAHCSRGRPTPSGSAPGVCGAQAPAVLWLGTPGSAGILPVLGVPQIGRASCRERVSSPV